jgi:DEAD/DEAH box helicase domain-containing protein
MLVGYPGTIASARQQAGRAGRGEAPAVAVFIASPIPLDQYLAHHAVLLRSVSERALINRITR